MTRRDMFSYYSPQVPSGPPLYITTASALLAKAPEKRKYAGDDVQWKVQAMHELQEMQKMQESAGDDVQWKEHIKGGQHVGRRQDGAW